MERKMMTVPTGTRTLVLNDDRMPLSIVHWKKAVKKIYSQDVWPPAPDVVEYYDIRFFDGGHNEYYVPAIVANRHHVKRNYRKIPFSRKNIFKRDGFHCQYCTKRFKPLDLTVDHVTPRSMWTGNDSPTCWHNLVTSCKTCNTKKRDRTPEQANMPLIKIVNDNHVKYKRPKKPNYIEVLLGPHSIDLNHVPDEWKVYLNYIIKDKICVE